jgi:ADP-ribose pyrophosphatase YjhB (NUDIX family)
MAVNGIDVRCSAIVFRGGAVLLVRRTYGGVAVWTLPGGHPA